MESRAALAACEHPMDRFGDAILQLLGETFGNQPVAGAGVRIPRQRGSRPISGRSERIRAMLHAQAAGMVEFTATGLGLVENTADLGWEPVHAALAKFARHFFPAKPGNGTCLGYETTDGTGRRLLCVPLAHDQNRVRVLVVVGPADWLLAIGEPLATLVRAMWETELADDPLQAEVLVLTALRSVFGRLPLRLYEHGFQRYQQLVNSLAMVFQPVVKISRNPREIDVHSYEALARRDLSQTSAPAKALAAAHIWGDRFVIERDILLLRKAMTSYVAADAEGAFHSIKPIAVNVSVRALLSDAYSAVVGEVLGSIPLGHRALTLEISEHDPIEQPPDETWPLEPLAYFHERLTWLARELEVSFAVDDFGVGYASLARMAELPLTQIKVDRAILHHPMALQELDMIVEIARYASDRGHVQLPRAVVVEGLDRQSPVTLHDLHQRRIHYVQGHITEAPAAPNLRPLGEELRARLATLTRGEVPNRVFDAGQTKASRSGTTDPKPAA